MSGERLRFREQTLFMPKNADADGWERRLYYWAPCASIQVRGDPISRVISSSIAYYRPAWMDHLPRLLA